MDNKVWIKFFREGFPVVMRLVSVIPEIPWKISFPDEKKLRSVEHIIYNLGRNETDIEVHCE